MAKVSDKATGNARVCVLRSPGMARRLVADPGMRSILADHPHDPRQALPPVRPYPAPVAGPLPPPAYRAPGAAQEREVQHDDGVGGPEPDVERTVIGPEVAI